MATVNNAFDLFVVGGGSGGIACARRASSHGARVGVAENKRLGGTCVNVGCVPKKIMWWASCMQEYLHDAPEYGFSTSGQCKFSWSYLKSRRDASVARLNGIYEGNLDKSDVKLFRGLASVLGKANKDGFYPIEIVSSEDPKKTEIVHAKHVLIAVGGLPTKLGGVPGEEHTINSDDFFALEECPRKVAVIGAGYIAVELAGVMNGLGAECHLFCRGEFVLRKFDSLISREVSTSFIQCGGILHPHTQVDHIEKDDKGLLTLYTKDGQYFGGFDKILAAIGRQPASEGLGLVENLKTQLGPKGYIQVDEYQNVLGLQRIYAVGDVCGKVELTPMAVAAGRRLADRLFLPGFENAKASYDMVPTVVFSHPPCATVGITEEAAVEKYGQKNLVIYSSTSVNLYYNVFKMDPSMKPKTRIKLICLKNENEKIVGLHMIGKGVDEVIQGFAVAVKMGATKADFDACLAIHPTMSEEVVTCVPWGLPQTK